jgi:hypothetical protein
MSCDTGLMTFLTNTKRESKRRWNKMIRLALLSAGAILLLLPGLRIMFPFVHAASGTVVVGPENQTAVGWKTLQGIFGEPGPDTGTQKYVFGPATPPIGQGSLEFRIGSNNNWSEAVGYTNLNGVSIGAASLTELSYSTYVQQSSNPASQDFFAILVIDTTGEGQTADDFLFFYPADQSGCSDGAPTQHTIAQNQWQQPWDARNGVWVSAFGRCNAQESCGTANDPKTLAEYLACFPLARIINDFDGTPGLIIGYGGSTVSANFIGNLDNVKIGVAGVTTTFDFDQCVLTCPADITQGNDPDQCGALVSYSDPSTGGGCSGGASCSPASGSFFPVGTTTVTCLETAPILGPIKAGPSGITCVPNTVTESSTHTITPGNSYSCGSGVSYWRAFDLAASFGITHDFDVQSVDIGIESATSGGAGKPASRGAMSSRNNQRTNAPKGPGQPLTIRLYTNAGGTFPAGTRTQIASANYTIPDQALTIVNLPIAATLPAGAELVVEVFAPNGQNPGNLFIIGSNSDPETAPSYVSAPSCGITDPTPTSDVSFPDMHIVMNVNGCEEVPSCTFRVTIQDNQNPTITCPANQVQCNDNNQCGAVVNYPAPTPHDNCPNATTACSPAAGSFFPKGTTTVSCTATDASGHQSSPCTFTVTVNDCQPPTITCQNVSTAAAASCPIATSAPVTLTVTATDNCPGVVTVVCKDQNNQPVTPGQSLPVGTTTVTCTATDASGNAASCSFTVTVFSFCLQDDSNPGNVVLVNAQTGDYSFCCGGIPIASGRGTLTVRGCIGSIDHIKGDRKVHIQWDTSANNSTGAGTAFVQKTTSGKVVCQITDKNMSNNSCQCSSPAP